MSVRMNSNNRFNVLADETAYATRAPVMQSRRTPAEMRTWAARTTVAPPNSPIATAASKPATEPGWIVLTGHRAPAERLAPLARQTSLPLPESTERIRALVRNWAYESDSESDEQRDDLYISPDEDEFELYEPCLADDREDCPPNDPHNYTHVNHCLTQACRLIEENHATIRRQLGVVESKCPICDANMPGNKRVVLHNDTHEMCESCFTKHCAAALEANQPPKCPFCRVEITDAQCCGVPTSF